MADGDRIMSPQIFGLVSSRGRHITGSTLG